MSRTFKDEKNFIQMNRIKKMTPTNFDLLKLKIRGYVEDFDYSICPDCKGLCEYERGYLTCHNCGWGSFINEYKYENGELEFSNYL